jgi:hypothetical protein
VSQQINLFNPIFLKQKKYFSALTMVQALGLLLLGSLLLTAFTNYQLLALSKEAKVTAEQLTIAQGQLTKISADYGPRPKSKLLEDDIQKTEMEAKSLQQVFDILKKGEFGNTKGYSEYLGAFSRRIVNGLWLTGLTIQGAGNEIGLQGRALQPDLVPAYIGRLKQEPVLQGKSFATLEMQVPQVQQVKRDDTSTGAAATQRVAAGYIDFSLRSSGVTAQRDGLPGAANK